MSENDEQKERRLGREASEICLGTLGDRSGVNVAKVEVSWYSEGLDEDYWIRESAGFYFVHATGDEPECQGEEGTIYNVFEGLVHEAMLAKQDAGKLDGYQLDDVSAA